MAGTRNTPSNSHKGSNEFQKSGKGSGGRSSALEVGSGNQAGSSLTKRGSNVSNKRGVDNPAYDPKTGTDLRDYSQKLV